MLCDKVGLGLLQVECSLTQALESTRFRLKAPPVSLESTPVSNIETYQVREN
jgi:hypothetical protein